MAFWNKKREITVQQQAVGLIDVEGTDYLCLTDMARGEEGSDHIKNWMRNRNTVEFLGLWEGIHNPNFKTVEFDRFRKEAGLNSFTLRPHKWVEATNAIGIVSKSGRYGGTYAHKDIAFEFGAWINPVFKLYLLKEYERLKEIESNQYNQEWDVRRIVSKANYRVQTDAIKEHIVPTKCFWQEKYAYTDEADIINLALFGCTSKEWREKNPERAKNENIRDSASINELLVLSNLESANAAMIREKIDKQVRFEKLKERAAHELRIFNEQDIMKAIKKTSNDVYLIENKKKS